MDTHDATEAARQAEVAAEQASNVWRGVKPVGVFNGALAQDNKDYPEYVDQYHTKTMVNPDLNQAARVATIEGEEASNVWRGVKPVGVFANALTQDHKDYPEHLTEQHKKSMDDAAALEVTRQKAVAQQKAEDAWRSSALTQRKDQKDYPEWVGQYNTKTMDNAAAIEAIRVSGVNKQ